VTHHTEDIMASVDEHGKTSSDAAAVRRRSEEAVQRRHPSFLRPLFDDEPVWARDFEDLSYEWRRLFSELLGTFFLVLVGAGGAVVGALTHDGIGRGAAVAAPGLMVAAIILFMGAVSGAHLNPAVSLAFAVRGDFQWRRVPGYVLAQLLGASGAAAVLRAMFGTAGHLGATLPEPGFTGGQAFGMEVLLTFGLVSVILGVSSAAQNVGQFAAIGVGSYIILAGLWSSPVSGASMNPARSVGPALVSGDLHQLWIYLIAPPVGAIAAVGAAWILRGSGGDRTARAAAEGKLHRN
jgi:aquaporin Z